ncbi:MAG TPA: lyase family protein [Limnochordia bacterium]|nr:lyase family protein [Limnochordia bacterium]
MSGDVFWAISPLDHRYRASDPALFAALSDYLSENAYIKYEARVEAALAAGLARRGICSAEIAEQIARACAAVDPAAVYAEEQRTHHNIRALVNVIQRQLPEAAKPFVHLSATSVDIMDTARALQYRDVTEALVLPELAGLLEVWTTLAAREADTLQVGRTHGQFAVPITFGFAVAEYVDRLGGRLVKLALAAGDLRGKMAGAVGAYNASSLFFADAAAFEREVLAELGLKPGGHSTQIVEPEYIVDYAHALISTFGVLANFADDIRHLQRSEIGEVAEAFEKGQVGSSTMPHKRNPWNFEHVKSMWKVFAPRMLTLYMDQISEHQRDLTNSASGRFIPEIVAGLVEATHRLRRVSSRLVVDTERMAKHVAEGREWVVAEPLYILLAAAGHPDAHEAVRKLTLEAQSSGVPVRTLAENDAGLAPYLELLSPNQRAIIQDPDQYAGQAAARAREIARTWREWLEATPYAARLQHTKEAHP